MPFKDKIKGKEYHKKYSKEWKIKNPDKVKIISDRFYKKNKISKLKKTVDYNRDRRHRYKRLALEMYGGNPPKCKCCGEDIYEFLTIDHINGGGGKHRKSLNNVNCGIYGWLLKNKYMPNDFQVLCMNCNMAKFHCGICPHQRSNQ